MIAFVLYDITRNPTFIAHCQTPVFDWYAPSTKRVLRAIALLALLATFQVQMCGGPGSGVHTGCRSYQPPPM
jgi:hypothetical protein